MIFVYLADNVKANAAIHMQACGTFLGTKYPPTASLIIAGCDDEPTIRLDDLTATDLKVLKEGIEHAEILLKLGRDPNE